MLDEEDIEATITKRLKELKLEEKRLETKLARVKEEKRKKKYKQFRIGDRVKLLTKGKYNFREATVVGISEFKITIRSDCKVETWRAPQNLAILRRSDSDDGESD